MVSAIALVSADQMNSGRAIDSDRPETRGTNGGRSLLSGGGGVVAGLLVLWHQLPSRWTAHIPHVLTPEPVGDHVGTHRARGCGPPIMACTAADARSIPESSTGSRDGPLGLGVDGTGRSTPSRTVIGGRDIPIA